MSDSVESRVEGFSISEREQAPILAGLVPVFVELVSN